MNIDNNFKDSFSKYFQKHYGYKKYECNLNNNEPWLYIQAGSGFGDNFHYELIDDSIQLHIEFKDKDENIFFANALIKMLKKNDYRGIIPNDDYIWFLLEKINNKKIKEIQKKLDKIIKKFDPIINQLFLFDFKRNKPNKEEKSINCRFISVCGIINEIIFVIPLVLIILGKLNSNFTFYLSVLLVIFTFACVFTLHIILYKILNRREKSEFLKKIILHQEIENEDVLSTKTTKNENSSDAATVTETMDSTIYDSKSKVLISAIEAIKDL